MQKRINIKSSTSLVFSRWSRKSFASFCSIGKNVIIARVKNEIANASLSKNNIESDSISVEIKKHNNLNDYLEADEISFLNLIIDINTFTNTLLKPIPGNTKSPEVKFILKNKHQYPNTIS